MRFHLIRFYFIMTLFWLYTAYKANQVWPAHRFLATAFSLVFFLIMVGWQFIYHAQPQVLDRSIFQALTWIGSLTLGFWATFILFSLPFDFLHALGSLFHLASPSYAETLASPERRTFLMRGFSLGVLGLSGTLSGLGFNEVLRGPRVKTVSIPIQNLPLPFHQLRIAQISDLHVGPTIRKGYVEEVVRRTNATRPDLIFVTGDLADGEVESLEPHLNPLSQLKARYGVFYVTGNHEYYWNALTLIQKVKEMGWTPLLNENRIITIDNRQLLVAGVTDPMGEQIGDDHRSDPKKAIRHTESPVFKILLAHRPETATAAEACGFDLQFSGHTHAGQFFPFTLLVKLAHKHFRGLSKEGRMWVYVNPGTGYWGPANRLMVSSEITLATLEPAGMAGKERST